MITVTPPPPKTDPRFDDWMQTFWQRLTRAGLISSSDVSVAELDAGISALPGTATVSAGALAAVDALSRDFSLPAIQAQLASLAARVSQLETLSITSESAEALGLRARIEALEQLIT